MAKCADFRKRNANQDTVPLYLEEVAIMATDQWRGPNATMSEHGPMSAEIRKAKGQTVPLDDQVLDWRAPQAGDATRGPKSQRAASYGYRDKAGMHSLVTQANAWAGPAAQNHKGSSQGSVTRADGKSRADILSYQAEQFFHPPSSPDQPTIAAGSTSSTDGPNSNQPSVKRKLNPIFVEALMRWPTGLSGFVRPETALIQWQQLMPSYVSMLISALPATPRGLFDD